MLAAYAPASAGARSGPRLGQSTSVDIDPGAEEQVRRFGRCGQAGGDEHGFA
jgi:hypothetical protein